MLKSFFQNKVIQSLFVLLVFTQVTFSQSITGPTPVQQNSTETYYFDDGLLHIFSIWEVTGGNLLNFGVTPSTTQYYATIQWGTTATGNLIFKSKSVVLGSMSVTINSGGSSNQNIVLSNENYIHSITPKIATSNTDMSLLADDDKIQSVTYFDGLGRAMQSVAIKASPDKKDIITHVEYDAYGRQEKEWLPYYETTGDLGSYRGDVSLATQQYYQTNFADDFAGVTNAIDINAYSQKELEASPLNRVFKQAAPGEDWKLGEGNEIELDYQSNTTSEVKNYTVTLVYANKIYTPTLILDTSVNNGNYQANELYKAIVYDENHSSGTNNSTEEFKDKQGRVILKRTYATIGNTSTKHDTYYIYDVYGNLTFVLPPLANADVDIPTSTELNDLCYQYKYDHRSRLVEKKIPGKGWEFIVYDNLDRPVLTQDALQNAKSPKEWLFTKYDVFGRVAYTGIFDSNNSRTTLQTTFNNKNELDNYEVKVTSGTGYSGSYYSNSDYPTSSLEILTINYYDDYTFNKETLSLPNISQGQAIINNNNANKPLTKSLPTGSKVRVLGTSNWITTITGYDVKGRAIYVTSNNTYLGAIDIIKSKLDFIGQVDKTESIHAKSGQATITTVDVFDYDHTGRMTKQSETINGGSTEVIAENTYDNLGQLISKGVGGTGTTRLQDVDYSYNVRGWLKEINDVSSLGTDLFAFEIFYNKPTHSLSTELYNGNISQVKWKSANTNSSTLWYIYNYDALNRITNAQFRGAGWSDRYSLEGVDYDKNGNITSLERKGHTAIDGNGNVTSYNGLMDDLSYFYSGNQLMKVSDAGNKTFGFKDDFTGNGIDPTNDYTYDINGNMISDANKGITNITYNHLNLPDQVSFGSENIQYFYDATGIKLKKIVSTGTTTNYAGNYIYEETQAGEELKFFNHAEGYIEPKNPNNYSLGFAFTYQYKDHLGNVRLSYSDADLNGSISQSEIIEESNYYPFGLKHKGYNSNIVSEHPYKYQGQELEEALDYDMYEFELRHYDAALGRFMTTDPYEQFMSPYVAMGNNPVVSFDPDGGFCYDSNGNQIACPDSDIFDDYRDSDDNNIEILDDVVVTPNPEPEDDNSEGQEGNDKIIDFDEKRIGDNVLMVGFVLAILDGPEVGPSDVAALAEVTLGMAMVSLLMQIENSAFNSQTVVDSWLKAASDASKNEKHGGQGLTDSEKRQVESLESQMAGAAKKLKNKLKKKIQNIKEKAQKRQSGEEHSRTKKGN